MVGDVKHKRLAEEEMLVAETGSNPLEVKQVCKLTCVHVQRIDNADKNRASRGTYRRLDGWKIKQHEEKNAMIGGKGMEDETVIGKRDRLSWRRAQRILNIIHTHIHMLMQA